MRRSILSSCIFASALVLPAFSGCSTANTPNTGGNGDNGNNSSGSSGNGNNSGNSGNGNNGSGSSGNGNNSGNSGNGNNSSGSSGNGNNSGNSSSSSSAGSSPQDGGGTVVVTSDASRTCAPASTLEISDFEEGFDVVTAQSGRTGPYSPYADGTGVSVSQTKNASGLYVAAAAPSDDDPGTCNKYALHLSDTGHPMYCGFGAPFDGMAAGTSWNGYDLSAYDGIQFDIKTGASSQGPVYFEVLTKETQPGPNPPAGPTVLTPGSGTATNGEIDAYNNRGFLFTATGSTPTGVGMAMPTTMSTTVYVPFAELIPRWFPSPTGCGTGTFCQAPDFVPAHALGLQFSVYNDFSTTGAYDIWLDNVALYSFTSANEGLVPPGMTMPTFNDGATGWQCGGATPTFDGAKYKAAGKFLLWAYHNWKQNFVAAGPNAGEMMVKSPEVDGGSVVSEGIAYGMLLAAYFDDETLFDGLWKFWSARTTAGSLMNWIYNAAGTSPLDGASEGSATDSDEDAAFALLLASHVWPTNATYATNATTLINDIWTSDIDHTSYLPTYGSNGGSTTANPTNPSYFAPAYYRLFASTQTGFNNVVTNVYTVLNSAAISGTDGLVPAWCTNNCTSPGSTAYANGGAYQYDAHRVPWRVGIDYCWNGAGGSAGASTYLAKISSFFSGKVTSGGIDNLVDEYTTGGLACTASTTPACSPAAAPNSMSLIGTAAVGALSGGTANATFVNAAWQFVLDGINRGTPNLMATGNNYYTYYNATVGLLTAVTMSGNFYKP